MKKTLYLGTLLAALLIFSGCSQKTAEVPKKSGAKPESAAMGKTASGTINTCKEEKVNLPNYGDPGQRLKNCFVKYPGEPSRQDKSYYIVEDICGQFTQAFMENMLGAKLSRIEPPQVSSINNCTYYLTEKEYVMLNLEYLKIENQKAGNEAIGYKVEKNPAIPKDNLVVTQEDGAINAIFLVLSPEKLISMRPSSKSTLTNDQFIGWAARIGEAIKDYK